jgi:isopenicillin N synthase-like dioxygenase
MHRVVQPDATESGSDRRQSMAFFHNTNFDAEIECIPTCLKSGELPKYVPVQAGEYLVKRFTSAVN